MRDPGNEVVRLENCGSLPWCNVELKHYIYNNNNNNY